MNKTNLRVKILDLPLSAQPYWSLDEWNKQLGCLNDLECGPSQRFARQLHFHIKFTHLHNCSNQHPQDQQQKKKCINKLQMYLRFPVHWQHGQAWVYHWHLQCKINSVPTTYYTLISKQAIEKQLWECNKLAISFRSIPHCHQHPWLASAHQQE